MSGIYYALSIVAIFIVIRWFISNDKKSPEENTTGFLAMRGLENQAEPSTRSVANKSQTAIPDRK